MTHFAGMEARFHEAKAKSDARREKRVEALRRRGVVGDIGAQGPGEHTGLRRINHHGVNHHGGKSQMYVLVFSHHGPVRWVLVF